MSFGYTDILWYLLAVPIGGVVLAFAGRRSLKTIEAVTGEYRRNEVVNAHVVRYFVLSMLFTGAVASLIFALAEPEWGEETIEDERRGLEIVFLIDVSNSMLAEDVSPSRLSRTRDVARTIASRVPEAHTAVIAFKGAATTIVPMTEDRVSFELAMSNLSGGVITDGGTDLADGLTTALDAFPTGSPRHQLILLFSDGQELENTVVSLSQEIRQSNVPIIAIQTGTEGGATIPIGGGEVMRDEDGLPVIAAVDVDVLQTVAELSGGRFVRIDENGVVALLVEEIRSRSGGDSTALFRREPQQRYHVFVVIALLFLMSIVVVQSIPWGRKRGYE